MTNPNPPQVTSSWTPQHLWERVVVGKSDECWPWTGKVIDRDGYGRLKIGDRMILTHRLAFLLATGIWSEKLILHTCDNARCCNPDHLYEGTLADNTRDRLVRGRSARGERNGSAKLRAAEVNEIRVRLADGQSCRSLGRQYGVSHHTVRGIRDGRLWSGIPSTQEE